MYWINKYIICYSVKKYWINECIFVLHNLRIEKD